MTAHIHTLAEPKLPFNRVKHTERLLTPPMKTDLVFM